jgi:hypothetical protein
MHVAVCLRSSYHGKIWMKLRGKFLAFIYTFYTSVFVDFVWCFDVELLSRFALSVRVT